MAESGTFRRRVYKTPKVAGIAGYDVKTPMPGDETYDEMCINLPPKKVSTLVVSEVLAECGVRVEKGLLIESHERLTS